MCLFWDLHWLSNYKLQNSKTICFHVFCTWWSATTSKRKDWSIKRKPLTAEMYQRWTYTQGKLLSSGWKRHVTYSGITFCRVFMLWNKIAQLGSQKKEEAFTKEIKINSLGYFPHLLMHFLKIHDKPCKWKVWTRRGIDNQIGSRYAVILTVFTLHHCDIVTELHLIVCHQYTISKFILLKRVENKEKVSPTEFLQSSNTPVRDMKPY